MNSKPKFFIVYPYDMIDQIAWPEGCDYRCDANLPSMLEDVLEIKDDSIGSEVKLIWNSSHRREMLVKNNITYDQLEDYLHSSCSMLSFGDKDLRKKVVETLKKLGAIDFICVDSYRDMILQQAFYKENKKFNLE